VTSTARGDLRKAFKTQPLPVVPAGTLAATGSIDATAAARSVLDQLNRAISKADAPALGALFLSAGQGDTYWKDQLALTSHLRTFHGPNAITESLLELAAARDIVDGFQPAGEAVLLPVGPTLVCTDHRHHFFCNCLG